MKRKKVIFAFGLSLITSSFLLSGCSGLLQPSIGETATLETSEETTADAPEGEGAPEGGVRNRSRQ